MRCLCSIVNILLVVCVCCFCWSAACLYVAARMAVKGNRLIRFGRLRDLTLLIESQVMVEGHSRRRNIRVESIGVYGWIDALRSINQADKRFNGRIKHKQQGRERERLRGMERTQRGELNYLSTSIQFSLHSIHFLCVWIFDLFLTTKLRFKDIHFYVSVISTTHLAHLSLSHRVSLILSTLFAFLLFPSLWFGFLRGKCRASQLGHRAD